MGFSTPVSDTVFKEPELDVLKSIIRSTMTSDWILTANTLPYSTDFALFNDVPFTLQETVGDK
jgi:hypothetical protein